MGLVKRSVGSCGIDSTGEKGIGRAFCGKGKDCLRLSGGVGGIGQIFWLIGSNSSRSEWE